MFRHLVATSSMAESTAVRFPTARLEQSTSRTTPRAQLNVHLTTEDAISVPSERMKGAGSGRGAVGLRCACRLGGQGRRWGGDGGGVHDEVGGVQEGFEVVLHSPDGVLPVSEGLGWPVLLSRANTLVRVVEVFVHDQAEVLGMRCHVSR